MTTRSPETAANPRRSAAPLPGIRLAQQREPEFALQPVEHLARSVCRTVVDDDELDAHRHREDAPDDFLDRGTLVVHGHDDRKQRIRRNRSRTRRGHRKPNRTTSGWTESGMSRRLIVFAPNWLGDAVMALPAVADIRQALPDAVIDIAARAPIAPLVPLIQGIGRSVLLGGRRASIDVLKAGGYDSALLLPNSFNTAWIARQAGIAERWGYRNEFRSILLTRAVAPPDPRAPGGVLSAPHYALGFPAGSPEPRLGVPQDLRIIGERPAGGVWMGPAHAARGGRAGSGVRRGETLARGPFAATIDALARDGVQSVLIGAGADAAAGARCSTVSTPPAAAESDRRAPTSRRSPRSWCIAATLVTNDSGAMHFAAALGIDVTAVFGPTNERETRPLGTGRDVVVTPTCGVAPACCANVR